MGNTLQEKDREALIGEQHSLRERLRNLYQSTDVSVNGLRLHANLEELTDEVIVRYRQINRLNNGVDAGIPALNMVFMGLPYSGKTWASEQVLEYLDTLGILSSNIRWEHSIALALEEVGLEWDRQGLLPPHISDRANDRHGVLLEEGQLSGEVTVSEEPFVSFIDDRLIRPGVIGAESLRVGRELGNRGILRVMDRHPESLFWWIVMMPNVENFNRAQVQDRGDQGLGASKIAMFYELGFREIAQQVSQIQDREQAMIPKIIPSKEDRADFTLADLSMNVIRQGIFHQVALHAEGRKNLQGILFAENIWQR